MKNILKIVSLFTLLLALSGDLNAAKRYWISSSPAYWNNTANWSLSSGGGSGASVPSSSDTAYFDGNGVANDTIDATVNIKRLDISAGFTGKLIQRSFSITIGTGGATLSGGIFSGGSAAISVTGSFTISGTAFTSTSNTLTIVGDYTLSSGSFTHNNGKVTFTTTNTITGSTTFYQLSFAPTSSPGNFTLTSGTNLTANGDFSYEGSQGIGISGDSIKAKGDVYLNNSALSGSPGTATLSFCSASGNQTLYGAASTLISNPIAICIKKGITDTLLLANYISTSCDWKLVSGVVKAGSSTLYLFTYVYGGGPTVTGTQTINNLTLDAETDLALFTIYSSSTLTVNGSFNITGPGFARINDGTIAAKGNISIGNSDPGGGGSGTIVINGTGSQSFSGSSALLIGSLCNVDINKSSGTLTLSNYITVSGNWTRTAGTLAAGTSTIYFLGSKTITGTQSLNNVRFFGSIASAYIINTGDTLTITGTMTMDGSDICSLYSGIICAKGDIANNNTYSSNFGFAKIIINGTGNQLFTGGSSVATSGRVSSIEINKASGTLTLADTLVMYGDWTYTMGSVTPGTSVLYLSGNIYGSQTLNSVVIRDGINLSLNSSTITVNGSLTYENGGSGLGNGFYSGTFDVKGNVVVSNTTGATIFGGIGTLKFSGTGNQSFTGSGTAATGKVPNINIDKSSGTLTLASIISVAGDWTYTHGTVNATTNSTTVNFYNTANLDGQEASSSNTMKFYKVGIGSGTVTLTGDIDIGSNLSIASGATLSAGSNNLTVAGKWVNVGGTWTYGTSTVIFKGRAFEDIKRTSGGSPATESFYNLTFNRPINTQILSSPVVINHNLTLTKGHIKATSTNFLELSDNATLTGGSDSAYVDGYIRKTGDDAFIFPLGDTTLVDTAYHPLEMTAPSSNTDQFDATYFASGQSYGSTLGTGIASISACEYWTFKRVTGSSTPTVSLNWNYNCDNSDYSEMSEVIWDGSQWNDLGQSSVTISSSKRGKLIPVSSTSFTANPSPITIGYATVKKSYSELSKITDGGYFDADGHELYFAFTEEYQDSDGKLSYCVVDSTDSIITLLGNENNNASVHYGENQYKIDLYDNTNTPLASGYYLLEVTNEKNEKWYLRFKI
jgi:hypothetical protein